MTITKLEDVVKMEHDQQLLATKGTVTKVFPRTIGSSAAGKEWSVQNVLIKSPTSEPVKVELWDRAEVHGKDLIGTTYLVACSKGDRGWTGVKVVDKEYNGKVEKRIKVTSSGVFEREDGAHASNQEPQPAPSAASSAPAAQSSEVDEKRACIEASKFAGKLGNAYKICIDRAMKVSEWYASKYGEPMPETLFTGMTTAFFIEGNKHGRWAYLPDNKDVATILPSLSVEEKV